MSWVYTWLIFIYSIVDKKVLKSLTNLSSAIESLVGELKNSDTKKEEDKKKGFGLGGFFANSMSKNIQRIVSDTKTIKEDNKKILKNQASILAALKSRKSDKDPISGLGEKVDKKKAVNLKDGVKTIVLIAGAVLAIGTAFSILGKIDFATVISLSVALPLLAMAFEKIAKIKNLTPQKVIGVLAVTVGLSMALMLSSWILSYTKPLSLATLGSVLIVGLTMGIVVRLLSPILTSRAFNSISLKSVAMLPLVLSGISLGLVAASYILQDYQALPNNLYFDLVKGALAIGAMGAILSVALFVIDKALGKVSYGNIIKANISLVIMSGAFALSSFLVSMGTYSNLPSFEYFFGFSLGMAVLAIPVAILGAIPLPALINGAIGLVLLSGAFALSSYLLSFINTEFLYKIADAATYFMKKFSDAIAYGLKVIAPSLKMFLSVVGKEIVNFASNILPIIVSAIGRLAREVLPPIKDFLLGFMPVLPYIVEILKTVAPLISTIVKSIAEVVTGVFTGIVNILNAIVDNIIKLSNVNGGNLLSVGIGLASVGAGLLAMTGGSIIDGISSLFGGGSSGILVTMEKMASYGKEIYLAGKGLDMLSNGLNNLSSVGGLDINKLNKAISSINLNSLSELAKYSGTVITLTPQAISDLMNPDKKNSEIAFTPTNVSTPVTNTQSSGSSSDIYLASIAESNSTIISLLSNIADNTRGFNSFLKTFKANKEAPKVKKDIGK